MSDPSLHKLRVWRGIPTCLLEPEFQDARSSDCSSCSRCGRAYTSARASPGTGRWPSQGRNRSRGRRQKARFRRKRVDALTSASKQNFAQNSPPSWSWPWSEGRVGIMTSALLVNMPLSSPIPFQSHFLLSSSSPLQHPFEIRPGYDSYSCVRSAALLHSSPTTTRRHEYAFLLRHLSSTHAPKELMGESGP
jgi:hypothetical protein